MKKESNEESKPKINITVTKIDFWQLAEAIKKWGHLTEEELAVLVAEEARTNTDSSKT